MAKVSDYRIIGDKPGECGAGWNMAVLTSGKLISSSTLDHSNISDRKDYPVQA